MNDTFYNRLAALKKAQEQLRQQPNSKKENGNGVSDR